VPGIVPVPVLAFHLVPTVEIDTAVTVAKLDTIAAAELANAPCPMCGALVQAARPAASGLLTVQPCGCCI
jgi:hypothetical protein